MNNLLNIVTMLGGLAFFLFGMNLLGSSLEKLSGGRLEKTLEKLTDNLFKGLLLGLLVTAAIQSSSATTVIVVGLVNSGILKLKNAIGVIMGANIGTTVTSLILSMGDLNNGAASSGLLTALKPTTWTPIIAIAGIIIFMVSKRTKTKMIGEVMLGFGILFNGMFIMTDAVKPFAELPQFRQLFATLSNPFLGVIAGAAVTAIIQSSSASVGILQAVAATGAVSYGAAIPIIMGQNIGTCVTSLISSMGANKNAKRAAMVHLYFNLIGTAVFFIGIYLLKYTIGFSFWDNPVSMSGISLVHIIFNLGTTVMFLPFTKLLEKLAILTVRDKKAKPGEEEDIIATDVAVLDERFLRSPSMALNQAGEVLASMGFYAKKNFERAIKLFTEKYDPKRHERIEELESVIDRMEDKLNNYLVALTDCELTDHESRTITHLLKIICEYERIGDYAINISELATRLYDQQSKLSEKAIHELQVMGDAIDEIIEMSLTAYKGNDLGVAARIEPLEEVIDTMEDTLKYKHIQRLKDGKCTIDAGLVFIEMLTNVERISDHCSNVAVYVIGYNQQKDSLNRHDYLKRVHEGGAENYNEIYNFYTEKYYKSILPPVKQTVDKS